MKIKVLITKKENADFYCVLLDSIIEIPLDEYLNGVVSSEIGCKYIEACKAQAIAARTFAWSCVTSGRVISDDSSIAQCFNALRAWDPAYSIAHQAVKETDGVLIWHDGKPISTCVYSASNGGKTTSSEARWGRALPYLIEQHDPYDLAVSCGKKRGHGVGMSQLGAQQAAKEGLSYEEILRFYYPGTYLHKEESPISQVKASDLVRIFKQMADEKWKYVAGAHKQGEVDCSGAFYYAYKQLGGYMYHGSNTMWRKYTSNKAEIGDIDLLPGMPVFKCRQWTSTYSNNGWYNTDPGDMYHVGCYIGNGIVVEAKSKKRGVVTSSIEEWSHAAQLIDTKYDLIDGETNIKTEEVFPFVGEVSLNSGYLHLRTGPSTSYPSRVKAYNGDIFTVTGKVSQWYLIEHSGKKLYAHESYIKPIVAQDKNYIITLSVKGEAQRNEVENILAGYAYKIKEDVA